MTYPQQQTVEVNGLQCIERGGEFWFSGVEIGRLLGYSDPQKQVNRLYQRHVQYLQRHTSIVNMTVEVGTRDVRVFDEEGTYYLCMKAETPQANEVSLQFASALKALRKQKVAELERRNAALEGEKQQALEDMLALPPAMRERLPQVVRYLRMGLNSAEVRKLMDCSQDTLRKVARRAVELGLLGSASLALAAPGRGLSEAEASRALELRGRGLSFAAIGREIGRSGSTVRDFCRREGV